MRYKSAQGWDSAPINGSKKFLSKTMIHPRPLG